jgi:hypothetical protein
MDGSDDSTVEEPEAENARADGWTVVKAKAKTKVKLRGKSLQ